MPDSEIPVNPTEIVKSKPVPPIPRDWRAPHKPTIRALVVEIWQHGGLVTSRDIHRHILGRPRPKATCYVIADALLTQLNDWRYMAKSYDPKTADEFTDEFTERMLMTGFLAEEPPSTSSQLYRMYEYGLEPFAGREPAVGEVVLIGDRMRKAKQRFLRHETNRWRAKAKKLERELTPKFLEGSREVRGQMVRDWIQDARRAGDLPPARKRRVRTT